MAKRSPGGLGSLPLFHGMTEAAMNRHGLRPVARSLKAGEHLFLAGEHRTRAWFAVSGRLLVRMHSPGGIESAVEVVGPGEMAGSAGYFGRATYPCTATALTESSFLGVPTGPFERWLRTDPAAAYRMAEALGRRLLETRQLRAINAERASVRVRLVVHWLWGKFGAKIPATRALLADLTGLRSETCSRALSHLRRRGVVRVSPRLIQVLRPDALEARP